MFIKIFADNHNPYKGSTLVQLLDLSGKKFLAQILPINNLDIDLLAKDRVSYELFYLQSRNMQLFQNNTFLDRFSKNSVMGAEYYVITNIPAERDTPTIVYGYAGFSKQHARGCLDLTELFASYYYESSDKYKVKYFGSNMIAYGAYLNDQIFGNAQERILNVPCIKKTGDKFYNKLNFIRYGLFYRRGALTRTAAEIMFNGK